MDLSQVSKGGKMKPPRILIYGQAGIGKTSFGAAAPKPIFLPIEDGLGKIDADAFPCPKSYTEQPGYGRGYVEALKYWREFCDRLNYLRDMKAMQTILVGHSIIREFKSPDTDSFDRYQIKLQQKAADLVAEHSDAILFANYKKSTMKSESRGGQRTRAIGSGERILYTEERPAWLAKNRYGLPSEMELSYDAFLKALKGEK